MPTPVPGLADKVEEVIEAAINAEMNESGWYGSCDDGFHVTARATEANSMPPDITVTYPEGQVLAYGDHPDDSLTPVIDVHEVYARWRRNIEQIFDRWAEMPEPDAFDAKIDQLRAIAAGLAVGGIAVVGEGAEVEVTAGNLDLHTYVADVLTEVGDCEGEAFEALYDGYLGRLAPVLNGQHALAVVLGTTLAGEQELWRRARTDIVDLAEKAREGFQKVADGGGGNLNFFLSLVGVAISAAGIFASGGTAIALGALGTANGLATLLIPAPETEPELELGGDSAHDVYSKLLVAASDSGSALQQEEQALYLAILAVNRSVNGLTDYYDFGTPSDFLGENRPAELFDAAENVQLVKADLVEAAAKLEAISWSLTSIDGALSTTGQGMWERDGMLGHLGYVGFYPQWNDLLVTLDNLIRRSSRAMGEVAERMVLVAHDFQQTDDQIAAELAVLVQELTDPTPTTAVRYGHP